MASFSVREAKTGMSKLLALAEAGGEVVITRRGKPIAKLVPLGPKPVRKAGMWKHLLGHGFSDSFFDPLPDDELALWNCEGEEPQL